MSELPFVFALIPLPFIGMVGTAYAIVKSTSPRFRFVCGLIFVVCAVVSLESIRVVKNIFF